MNEYVSGIYSNPMLDYPGVILNSIHLLVNVSFIPEFFIALSI